MDSYHKKTTIDEIMEANIFIEPVLERRGFVIMTSLDVKEPSMLPPGQASYTALKEFNCPRNLYNLSKGYFSIRTAVLTMKNVSETRRITIGCPQGSFCGPGFWNVLYSSLLEIELTNHSKAIAFADELVELNGGTRVVEEENYMYIEMKNLMEWATNNRLMSNENKSRTVLTSRRRRKEKEEIEIYVNNILKGRKYNKPLGIIFEI